MAKTLEEVFRASRKISDALSKASGDPSFAKEPEAHLAKLLTSVFPRRKPHKNDKKAILQAVIWLKKACGPFKPGQPVKVRHVDGLIVIATISAAAETPPDEPSTNSSLWDWIKQLIGLGPGGAGSGSGGGGGGAGDGDGSPPMPDDDLTPCQLALDDFSEAMEAFDEARERWLECTHQGMPGGDPGGGGGNDGGGVLPAPEDDGTPDLPPVYIEPCQDELEEVIQRSDEVQQQLERVNVLCDFSGE